MPDYIRWKSAMAETRVTSLQRIVGLELYVTLIGLQPIPRFSTSAPQPLSPPRNWKTSLAHAVGPETVEKISQIPEIKFIN